jgi:hypothetical protein
VKIELSQRLAVKRFLRLQIVTAQALCNAESRCRSFKLCVERRMGDWMSGSERVAAYRLHAAHCAEIAQRSSDPEASASLIKMSVAWLRLADLAQKNSESQPLVAATAQLVQSDPVGDDSKC